MAYQPVVAVVGHVDHGKSTLLNAIRKDTTAEKEAGGITQRINAYEVTHTTAEGIARRMSFIDTPGHEAFGGARACASGAADVAMLVVAADEGVKPQTIECATLLKKTKMPFVVALTKSDKPSADDERAKQSLAEHEICVEGYGGSVPCALVSAKTGAGVSELLDLVLLLADLHEKSDSVNEHAHGVVLETERSKTKGICATLIVKAGILRKEQYIVSGSVFSGIRMMEDWMGKPCVEAKCGRIARTYGWDALPKVGETFRAYKQKPEAEQAALAARAHIQKPARGDAPSETESVERVVIPLVVKADTVGSLDAVRHEIEKVESGKVAFRVLSAGLGNVGEGDLRSAASASGALILGFNVGVDAPAQKYSKATGATIRLFDIIYRLVDFLVEEVEARTPRERREEVAAQARIVKIFSEEKNTQIVGGKVLAGILATGNEFRILRRGERVGTGKVKELQHLREKIREVLVGTEFGALSVSSIPLAVSDIIEVIKIVEV